MFEPQCMQFLLKHGGSSYNAQLVFPWAYQCPSASDMAVQVIARNHASNHASNHAPKLLFRARLFFGRNRLRVYRIYSGAVCERSQILANGRHILSQVPSNPMFAIRCLQKVVCAARRPTIARRAARKNHSILSMMSRSSLIRSRSSRV